MGCDTLVSDNASCFTNSKFKQFLENNGIIHITPPPYSPSSNGQAERGVRVVNELLKKYQGGESFKTRLAQVLFHYRTVPHFVTNIPPSVSLNNRKFVSVKDRINPKYTAYIASCEFKQITKFEELDVIWIRHCNQLLSIIGSEPKNSISNESSCVSSYNKLPSQQQVVQPYVSVESPSNVSPQNNINVPAIGVSGDIPVTDVIPIRRSTRNRKPVIRYGYDEY
ncbi:uncharacterized protein [Palaemon carinicauda]|uniref:uncharacterized protein n=1 Tax=Palaemon carinicauda TaxID=392227 RepID=UPI0035B5C9DE